MFASTPSNVVSSMIDIVADTRWIGPHGIGRFADEVLTRLAGVRPLALGGRPLGLLDPLAVSRRIRRLDPDVYFSPGFNPPPCCPVPFVFTIHDLVHLDCPHESSAAKRAYYRWLVRPATGKASAVLTVSEFSKRRILAWSGLANDRVVVVGNGVGPPFVPHGPKHSPGYQYLLHVGNCKPHRNLTRLLEAFAASDLGDNVRLMLTGSPTKRVQREISQLGLEEHVALAGELSDEQLAAHYRGAMALVLVSLYEGFGLPALEAMACGTPVVASNAASLPEVTGDAAVMVNPHEVDSICDGLRAVAGDADLREELSRRGIVRAGQFTWDRTADIVRRVLTEAAGQVT